MTAQSKTALRLEVSANYPDNTSALITPAIVRSTSTDGIDSWQQAPQVNSQLGTSYTVTLNDYGQAILFSNASPVAVTLPAATTTSFFPFNVLLKNNNTGVVTVTPVSGTIDGAANLTLGNGAAAWLVSDGTNWRTGILSSLGGAQFTATTPGTVPAPGAGVTTTFLRADGTWISPAGAGNVVGSPPTAVGHLATWNNVSGTAAIDTNDWGIAAHALVPVNDNASDLGVVATNRIRAVYGITYNGQTYNLQGATSGVLSFNVPATVTNYTLTWPNAAPSAASGMLVSTGGAVSFGPVVQPGVSQNLTVGFTATSFPEGTVASGTYTPQPASGNFQHYTNNGAHTLAPPVLTCTMVIDMTNGASAGTVTTSGFTKVDGDALDTTNAHVFRFYISVNVTTNLSHLNVKRMV